MMEQIKPELEKNMSKSIETLKNQFTKVRTGRASANVLDGIMVDYYGAPTAIKGVGQISTPEARLLQIQPFDKTLIPEIEKSILHANIGLTPSNDGNFIRIPFPALTEDKRKDLVKQIKKLGEDSKVSIRNTRRDQNEVVKKAEKDKAITEDDVKKFLADIQKVTDGYVAQVDDIVSAKEKELMTV